MTKEQIKEIQRKIGVKDDGIFGKKSRKAVKEYLCGLMPVPHPFPYKADKIQFYGEDGPRNTVSIDVQGLGIEYMGAKVKTVRCHNLIADNLKAALVELSESEYKDILKYYLGCFMERNSRGSNKLSNHAWAIAIDFKLPNDGYRTKWPDNSPMPFGVMEIMARHGFKSGGAFWGFDAMHFEAIRPKIV